MALSYAKYTGTGTTTQFPITFPYIDASHIFVSVNGVDVAFSTDTINQVVTLSSAPALSADIRVYRFTPRNKTYSDFSRGNALGQRNMNNSFLWQLYISQEIAEGGISPEFVMNQDLNMGGNKVTNMGIATDDKDAVTYKQLNDALINISAQGVIPIVGGRQVGIAGQSQYDTPATSAASPASFRISIDGLLQRPVTDYTTDTIGKVDFVGTVPVGADIDVVFFEPNNIKTDASNLLVTSTGSNTPRKLSDRFTDVVNVKDFGAKGDGVNDDTTAYINAIASGSNIFIPKGTYLIGNVTITKDVIIHSDRAIIKPNSSGTIFNVNHSGNFEIYNTIFQLGTTYNSGSDIGINMVGCSRAVISGCQFYEGGYHTRNENCDNLYITDNFFDQPSYWAMYVLGGKGIYIANNTSNRSAYDGIKIAGYQDGQYAITERVVITGNTCNGNARDGLDMAVNRLENVTVSDNVFTDNTLQGIDMKVVSNPSNAIHQLMRYVVVNGNVITGSSSGQGINLQCPDTTSSTVSDVLVTSNFIIGSGASGGAGVRFSNVTDSTIEGNTFKQTRQGVRLIDSSAFNVITDNRLFDCTYGVETETQTSGAPSNNKVFNNFAQNHQSSFAILRHGANNEFFENRIEMANPASSYTLSAENVGLPSTGTKWYGNIVGTTQTQPIGWRVVVGDEWLVSQPTLGLPTKFVAIQQIGTSTINSTVGVGQVGFRTNAGTPVGSLTPQFVGESVYDTSSAKWWKAFGTGQNNWA